MMPVLTASQLDGSARSLAGREHSTVTVWLDQPRRDALVSLAEAEGTSVQRLLSEGVDAVLINRKAASQRRAARLPLAGGF